MRRFINAQTAGYRPQKGQDAITNLRRRTAMAAAGLRAALGGWAACWFRRWTPISPMTVSSLMSGELPGCPLSLHYPITGRLPMPQRRVGQAWRQRTPARAEQVALEKCGDEDLQSGLVASGCGGHFNGSKYQAEPDSRAARRERRREPTRRRADRQLGVQLTIADQRAESRMCQRTALTRYLLCVAIRSILRWRPERGVPWLPG